MIEAYLMTAAGVKKRIGGTGNQIVIHQDRMELGAGLPVATHHRHAWELDGELFLVMKIDSPVTVRLVKGAQSRDFGPFPQLWIVDGMILSGLDDEKAVADFQYESKLWFCPADNTLWETIAFIEA